MIFIFIKYNANTNLKKEKKTIEKKRIEGKVNFEFILPFFSIFIFGS